MNPVENATTFSAARFGIHLGKLRADRSDCDAGAPPGLQRNHPAHRQCAESQGSSVSAVAALQKRERLRHGCYVEPNWCFVLLLAASCLRLELDRAAWQLQSGLVQVDPKNERGPWCQRNGLTSKASKRKSLWRLFFRIMTFVFGESVRMSSEENALFLPILPPEAMTASLSVSLGMPGPVSPLRASRLVRAASVATFLTSSRKWNAARSGRRLCECNIHFQKI